MHLVPFFCHDQSTHTHTQDHSQNWDHGANCLGTEVTKVGAFLDILSLRPLSTGVAGRTTSFHVGERGVLFGCGFLGVGRPVV